jgi:hypothetical protein
VVHDMWEGVWFQAVTLYRAEQFVDIDTPETHSQSFRSDGDLR